MLDASHLIHFRGRIGEIKREKNRARAERENLDKSETPKTVSFASICSTPIPDPEVVEEVETEAPRKMKILYSAKNDGLNAKQRRAMNRAETFRNMDRETDLNEDRANVEWY